MVKSPLFSTYRQGENRVTSSMLAVFERIDLSLLETLLGAAAGEAGAIQMVSFVNQPSGVGGSVPDAKIAASFAYWFEVKTARNAVQEAQLRGHIKNFRETNIDERLFVITPDSLKPEAINRIGDKRLVWFNFRSLSDAIDEQLDVSKVLVSEQAQFLLRELQALLIEDGLLDTDNVVIVAAREAYPFYLKHHAYVCQPGRAFKQELTHVGFYTEGKIREYVPKKLYAEDHVLFERNEAERRKLTGDDNERRVAELIEVTIAPNSQFPRSLGSEYQVFLLTQPGDAETTRLSPEIENDHTDKNGNPCAWTMGQRYTSLEKLIKAKRTSQLHAQL